MNVFVNVSLYYNMYTKKISENSSACGCLRSLVCVQCDPGSHKDSFLEWCYVTLIGFWVRQPLVMGNR